METTINSDDENDYGAASYCEIFADKIRDAIGENGAEIEGATFFQGAVYDQTNPARVWTGTPTVEIMEADVGRSYYLSGKYRDKITLEIAARTQTRKQASAASLAFRRIAATICAYLVDAGRIDDFNFGAYRVYPDERGRAIGESFYCVIPITLFEAPKNEDEELAEDENNEQL